MKEIRLINATVLKANEMVRKLEEAVAPLKVSVCRRNPLLPAEEKNAKALTGARYMKNMSPTIKKNLGRIEKRLLKEKKCPNGIIYDGFKFQRILSDIFKEKRNPDLLTVCLTMRLLGTPEAEGAFPHIRMLIMGNPAVVSLRGIFKGPAKSRLRLKGENALDEMDGIKDRRIGEIIASLILQAAFYFFLGEAFCESRDCRLFNPHWRQDMLASLAEEPSLCRRHAEMLEKLQGEDKYLTNKNKYNN